ncbi:hypothetical protein LTR15_000204 [Elasticomyces elasticus]|nr:hypothetical protein LTR15_000204 [Elasticomyces elasticus]
MVKAKPVMVAIRQYRFYSMWPASITWPVATSGGIISITPTTTYQDVTYALLSQAGLNLGIVNLDARYGSVKSSLLLKYDNSVAANELFLSLVSRRIKCCEDRMTPSDAAFLLSGFLGDRRLQQITLFDDYGDLS